MRAKSPEIHRELGLTDEEFDEICTILDREPNRAELAMYSAMWSEHCSYKSSKIHLKNLPTGGPEVIMGPGEGAGVVRVGNLAVAFRLESHNHPSFVEPFQGAATGVGGIVRDILSVGARPVALLDPLRFGPLPIEGRVPEETAERNRNLVEGVVNGISSYGNCIGVPTVGGEVKFEDCYSGNPLVNVMCIGVAPLSRITTAKASEEGSAVLLVGSTTGKDGIGGVSILASASFDDTAEAKRPSVQVGDPFTEKLVIEACLEMLERGIASGVQDLGGAGLSCATSETAAAGGSGMRIDLTSVPRREANMEPFEVLISESQERMLLIVPKNKVAEALEVCERWGVNASEIGVVTKTSRLEISEDGKPVADVPSASLGEGPSYDRPAERPSYLEQVGSVIVDEAPGDVSEAILKLIGSPSIGSKRWVFEQYDHQVMLGTVVKPGHDATVLRLANEDQRIAVTTDGNGRWCYIDPKLGAKHAVAEAYRNLSTVGARPIAITNCLNFGNPENPEVMWQFTQAVQGMGQACSELNTPVTGGNVSFYNESEGNSIYPTPVVGMIGVLSDKTVVPPLGFRNDGDAILLVGATLTELGGSEYARTVLNRVGGRLPGLDLEVELKIGNLIRQWVVWGLLASAHDLSEGGLAVALAEASIQGRRGAKVELSGDLSLYQWLFSESASRYLVSCSMDSEEELTMAARQAGIPALAIGEVGGSSLKIGAEVELPLTELIDKFENSFARAMGYG